MAEWLPPDPDDRAYYEARTRRHRAFAWAGIAAGVLLLVVCGPALWSVSADGTEVRSFEFAWPVWGCTLGLLSLGVGLQHFRLHRR